MIFERTRPISLAITLGDPRGIGPEVMLAAASRFRAERSDSRLHLVGPGASVGMATELGLLDTPNTHYHTIDAGQEDDRAAGSTSVGALREAVGMARSGEVDGIVTGPVSKPALWAAGEQYPGQTEMLARWSDTDEVGMLMAAEETRLGGPLRVLLATTHVALREVPDRLTAERLVSQCLLLDRSLRAGWGLESPKIALCALNPHASDDGLFGSEEAEVLEPALERVRADGVSIAGPIPADTVFSRTLRGEFDAVVAPYHDVGMAAFKTVSFGTGVNVTLGLPFVRTSPDHGTAFDLVGSGRADHTSAYEAVRLAHRLCIGLVDKRPHSERTLN